MEQSYWMEVTNFNPLEQSHRWNSHTVFQASSTVISELYLHATFYVSYKFIGKYLLVNCSGKAVGI